MKRSTKTMIKYMSFVWLFTTCLAFLANCAPKDGKNGLNGIDLNPSSYDIVEIIDPCGKQAKYDEVILRMKNGTLIAHYSDGNKNFFLLVEPGNYKTTDGTECYFSVSETLEISWGI